MCVNVFRLLFFIFRMSSVLYVNTEPLFKLSSGLLNIFLFATVADNYIHRVGSSTIKVRIQNKWMLVGVNS